MKLDKLDKFNISSSTSLSSDDLYSLTLLYQPLIGSEALGIYLMFNSLLERSNMQSQAFTHADFWDILGLDETKFLNSRLKLEAIGLISTFIKDNDYIYLLKPPLTPKQFIADGTLGIYLYSKIGEKMFMYLVDRFKINKIDKNEYKNITVNFDNVFSSQIPEYKLDKGENYLLGRKPNKTVSIEYHDFDFNTFLSGINQNLIEFGVSDSFKKTIINSSFVYGFDEGDMQSIFGRSINKNGVFDYKLLKKEAKILYEFKHSKQMPVLQTKLPENPKNSLIYTMDRITGVQLLNKFCSNGYPTNYLKIVTDIYEQIDLPRPVINFMIMNVLNDQGGELMPLPYFKKVAETWAELGITTPEKAYDYVDKNQKSETPTKRSYNKKNNDKNPSEWVKEYAKNIKKGLEEI